MRLAHLIGLSAAALAIASCGSGSSHPVCKDEASARTYMLKFSQEMIDATTAGKLDPSSAQAMNDDIIKAMDGVKDTDWADMCTKADAIRKKYGL